MKILDKPFGVGLSIAFALRLISVAVAGNSGSPVKASGVAPPVTAELRQPAAEKVTTLEVLLAQVPRITPLQTETNDAEIRGLLAKHSSPKPPVSVLKETDEQSYKRSQPFPLLDYTYGEEITFGPEGPNTPRGAVAVEGKTVRFRPGGKGPGTGVVLWHWDVPKKFQSGSLVYSHRRLYELDDRFVPVHIVGEGFSVLYMFDALSGLRWQFDQMQHADLKDYSVEGFATKADGDYTLLVLNSAKEEANEGTDLLVLDQQGHLVSHTHLKGVHAEHLPSQPVWQEF